MDAQRTIRRQISCVGIGLHSGNKVNLTLKPAPADFGVRFRRTDLGDHEVPAPARTFTFLKDVEKLRQNGLALGGSLENAIVLGETGVLNNALRFEDEFVRHKILDAIGDLALIGYPVIGHLVAHRAGHALHTAFAVKILEETHAWRLVEAPVDIATPAAVGLPAHGVAARMAN